MGTGKRAYDILRGYIGKEYERLSGLDQASAEAELDETGNIELRCWACAAGALGERKPDVVSWDPSWSHPQR